MRKRVLQKTRFASARFFLCWFSFTIQVSDERSAREYAVNFVENENLDAIISGRADETR